MADDSQNNMFTVFGVFYTKQIMSVEIKTPPHVKIKDHTVQIQNPLVRSYLRVQNGQGRVIFLTWSSGKPSDNQKSDFTKYSIFSPKGESGKLQIFTRPKQISRIKM